MVRDTKTMTLTVGSLFSGIGGLDLGLERAGMRVIWQSEIDPYACRVLRKHWPEVVNHGNIKEIDWEKVERPDVICGGYPCQPFSTAGKRRGEEDPRHLWPWVREAIMRLRPRYAILENVRGHLSLGGLSVIGELASIGYDAEWRIVSAASVGANHRRDRIIIVAYPHNTGSHRKEINSAEGRFTPLFRLGGCGADVAYSNSDNSSDGGECSPLQGESRSWRNERSGSGSDTGEICVGSAGESAIDVANTNSPSRQFQQEWQVSERYFEGCGGEMADTDGERLEKSVRSSTEVFPSGHAWGSSIERRQIFSWWETEPDVGRVADGIPNRVDRLRGLGNAVVPQVAEVIGRLVVAHAG